MSKRNFTRREFVKQNSLAGLGVAVAMGAGSTLLANCAADTGVPAILDFICILVNSFDCFSYIIQVRLNSAYPCCHRPS